MSQSAKPTHPLTDDDSQSIEDRLAELEEVRDELELVAQTDLPYAKHARGFLATLEERGPDA